jgi:hypothetical protein
MLLPAVTGDGAPELATTKSTALLTIVLSVVELLGTFGSLTVEVIDELAVMVVPSAVAAFTFTLTLMFATVPAVTLGFMHVVVPVAPTAGVTQVQPAGALTD